jgi:hypothetical protein
LSTSHRYKVRGEDVVGTEVGRRGDQVTLMCAPLGWPFVRERTYPREALVRLDGDNSDDEVPQCS